MSPFANALTDADRFWSKVDRSGDCWIWMGATHPDGYGKVMIDQTVWRAHRLAWFMVMGTLPKHGLYHIRPEGGSFSRVNPGAREFRGCVRPHHFRDGPPEAAPTRWARRAQSGFPPEFRQVQGQMMGTEQAQTDLMPLLLYRGSLTFGRAQALFNFTLAAQAAEAERLGDVVAMSRAWPDVSHAVGLHKPVSAATSVGHFWDRVIAHPGITEGRPGLREYIRDTQARSGWRAIRLVPIDRYSPWSTRRWRSGRRSMDEIRQAAAERKRQQAIASAPLPEVWPFIPGQATSEHDLVLAVDEMVPKSLPEGIRQDVCQDLILSVLEGSVDLGNLRDAVPEQVRRVFRQYPGKYGPLSLDQGRGDDGEWTLGETLADAPLILDGGFGSLAELRDRLREEEAAA